MKDITITLVNFNSKDDILLAVASVLKDIKDSALDVHIVVVDNSVNADGIRKELVKQYPEVKYINPEDNIGFGRGNIRGFKDAPARYYFALNQDTIIPEGNKTIERLVRFMDANPKIGCVGPKLVNMDGSLQYACYRFDLRSILIKPLKQINWDEKYKWVKKYTDRLLMKDFNHNETRPVDWVLGAAMVVRREAVEAVGWFDERYFMYMEDCDWCRTMWDNGWPVYYVHDIIVKHRHARESARVRGMVSALIKNNLARIHLVSWFKYLWKWRGTHKFYNHS